MGRAASVVRAGEERWIARRLAALGVDALGTDDPQALVERWKGREPR